MSKCLLSLPNRPRDYPPRRGGGGCCIGMHDALPKDWWSLPRVAAKKYRFFHSLPVGGRLLKDIFFSLHFRRIILFFWTFLDTAVAFLFIHSLRVVRLEKYETHQRGVYYIFQTHPEVRRCGGMRQKHCILYYSGALMLHNTIVLGARGRALWFLIKTCAILFHPFHTRIEKTYTVPMYVCIWRI